MFVHAIEPKLSPGWHRGKLRAKGPLNKLLQNKGIGHDWWLGISAIQIRTFVIKFSSIAVRNIATEDEQKSVIAQGETLWMDSLLQTWFRGCKMVWWWLLQTIKWGLIIKLLIWAVFWLFWLVFGILFSFSFKYLEFCTYERNFGFTRSLVDKNAKK